MNHAIQLDDASFEFHVFINSSLRLDKKKRGKKEKKRKNKKNDRFSIFRDGKNVLCFYKVLKCFDANKIRIENLYRKSAECETF